MSRNRANALGALFSLQEKWEDALAAFKEGERRGGDRSAAILLNIGISLAKLGRGDEAHPYLMKAVELGRNQTTELCYACRTLAELGYWDDAREVFRQVDESRKGTIYLTSSLRKMVEAEVERCRALLADKPAVSADDLLDEF